MNKKNRNNDFSLSFLDIMACGLGGVIIIFLLLENKSPSEESSFEINQLKEDIVNLNSVNQNLLVNNQVIKTEIDDKTQSLKSIKSFNSNISDNLTSLNQEKESFKKGIEQLKKSIKEMPQNLREDPISNEEIYEEEYIEGLTIRGSRICILLDSSSSMTDEKLVEIIKRKNSSDEEKKNGQKWKRTIRIVKWILARAPQDSEVAVIKFSKNAKYIAKKSFKAGSKKDLQLIFKGLDNTVPSGPTNLVSGLIQAEKFKPTNIYLITDGLPTFGGERFKSLNPFSKCDSIVGSSSKISGDCRVKLFEQSIRFVDNQSAVVDIILLPVEGDPQASPKMWNWASSTGGLLISPAKDWP